MVFNYKSASKKQLKDEYNRIANEANAGKFLTKKELMYLPDILQLGEEILTFTSGLMDKNTWLITLTDRRIIFLDKGMLYGLKQEDIPLNRVNAISSSTGLFFGNITITDGAKGREISNVFKKTVKAFTNKCQEALDAINSPQSYTVQQIDPYAQLEKLATFKDKGIISADEFEIEKQKILA